MVSTLQLNLTRKWRSKTFDEIVGQKLPVRLLKNSLYRGQLFPVYLFSGLRGSGKTSMGRIFAAAVNCKQLSRFRTHPQEQFLPCLQCDSCLAMSSGSHPDFIEIDAASHTGVDNVRQIIESASFLPVMGSKKIYLIDEAHMLSKAAFNAFLKILEEPPATALFLLATTDPHKIIETVKSRSFQLFFDPIHSDDLVPHLAYVCDQEKITYEHDALELIAREGEGSARDALNILERVRLVGGKVTVQSVYKTLGVVSDDRVIELLLAIGQGDVKELFELLQEIALEHQSAVVLWKKLVAALRSLVWAHHGIVFEEIRISEEKTSELTRQFSLALLTEFLEQLYRLEAQFIKTVAQHGLLEMLLCKMAQRCASIHTRVQAQNTEVDEKKKSRVLPKEELSSSVSPEVSTAQLVKKNQLWSQFLQEIFRQGNPVASSIFQNGTFVSCNDGLLQVRFAKKFEFHHEWLLSNEVIWKTSMESVFGAGTVFSPDFSGDVAALPSAQTVQGVSNTPEAKQRLPERRLPEVIQQTKYSSDIRKSVRAGMQKIDVSDKEKWKKSHMLLRFFPGTVHLVQE